MDDERLKAAGDGRYFDELLERTRAASGWVRSCQLPDYLASPVRWANIPCRTDVYHCVTRGRGVHPDDGARPTHWRARKSNSDPARPCPCSLPATSATLAGVNRAWSASNLRVRPRAGAPADRGVSRLRPASPDARGRRHAPLPRTRNRGGRATTSLIQQPGRSIINT